MVEQEILEGNKLIAEFMGYKFGIEKYLVDEGDEYNYKFKPFYRGIIFKDKLPENKSSNSGYDFREYNIGYDENLDYGLKYHSSWDCLMLVVEKIMQISNDTFYRYSDIVIKKDSCELWIGQHIKSPVIGLHVIVSSDWNGYKNDNYLHIFKKYNGSMYCIDYCYIAIIEFIKWYNKCQKN